MKKFILILLATVMAMPTFAQYQSNRSRSRYNHNDTESYYGIRLGLNSASTNCDDAPFDLDARTGLNIGAVYGLQLANNTPIWLEAGAYYAEKGGKSLSKGIKKTYRLRYIEIPCVVKYNINADDDFFLQPFLGGYIALGVGGKIKNYADRTTSSAFDSDRFQRFDGGLRLGCGAEYNMIYAEVGFDLGIANVRHDDFEAAHTRSLFVNFGVNF